MSSTDDTGLDTMSDQPDHGVVDAAEGTEEERRYRLLQHAVSSLTEKVHHHQMLWQMVGSPTGVEIEHRSISAHQVPPQQPHTWRQTREELLGKLERIGHALESDDDVETVSQYISLRRDMRKLRDKHKKDRSRFFTLSILYNALLFNTEAIDRLDHHTIQVVAKAVQLVTAARLDSSHRQQLRRLLLDAGLSLVPTEAL